MERNYRGKVKFVCRARDDCETETRGKKATHGERRRHRGTKATQARTRKQSHTQRKKERITGGDLAHAVVVVVGGVSLGDRGRHYFLFKIKQILEKGVGLIVYEKTLRNQ